MTRALSRKEALILRLLCDGAEFGQDLVDRSDGALIRGTVYVRLAHLEDRRLVESEVAERTGVWKWRLKYKCTSIGLRALRDHRPPRIMFSQTLVPWVLLAAAALAVFAAVVLHGAASLVALAFAAAAAFAGVVLSDREGA